MKRSVSAALLLGVFAIGSLSGTAAFGAVDPFAKAVQWDLTISQQSGTCTFTANFSGGGYKSSDKSPAATIVQARVRIYEDGTNVVADDFVKTNGAHWKLSVSYTGTTDLNGHNFNALGELNNANGGYNYSSWATSIDAICA